MCINRAQSNITFYGFCVWSCAIIIISSTSLTKRIPTHPIPHLTCTWKLRFGSYTICTLVHRLGHLSCQQIRLILVLCLGIHSHHILSPRRSHKSTATGIFPNQAVDLLLQTIGGHTDTLCVRCRNDIAILDQHLQLPVWQILVLIRPVTHVPSLVQQDRLHQQHVRNSITHCLIDQVDDPQELFSRANNVLVRTIMERESRALE